MTWLFDLVWLVMGAPNAAAVLASSTPKQRNSSVWMAWRWVLAVISLAIWPAAALFVYYKDLFRNWPRKAKDVP